MSGNLERSTRDSSTWSMLLGSYCESSKGTGCGAFSAGTLAALPTCIPAPATRPIPYNHWRRLITYLLRLLPRIEHGRRDVSAPLLPIDRTMPHASAERRDVDLIGV